MAANNWSLYGGIPVSKIANVSTADTSNAVKAAPSDGAALRLLLTGATEGSFINEIDVQPIGTGTPNACIMHLWKTDNAGANAQVFRSIVIPVSAAISTTVPGTFQATVFNLENIEAGVAIYVSFTLIAANTSYNVTLLGGHFTKQ